MRTTAKLSFIGALLFTLLPVSAQALEPPALWTFPQDGQQGVPTNAQLWLIAQWITMPTATLNGEPIALERIAAIYSPVRGVLPELEPNTDYAIIFEVDDPVTVGARKRIELAFSTGSGPAATLPAPTVNGSRKSVGVPADHACEDIIKTQDVFDTGQNTLLSFDVEVEGEEIGWLVFPHLDLGISLGGAWPASCEEPTMYVSALARSCYDLHAIGPAGHVSAGTRYCPAPAIDPGRPSCFEVLEITPSGEFGARRSSCDSTSVDAGVPSDAGDASVVAPMVDAGWTDTGVDAAVVVAPMPDAAVNGSEQRDAAQSEPLDSGARGESVGTPVVSKAEPTSGCAVASFERKASPTLTWLVTLAAVGLLLRVRRVPRARAAEDCRA